MHDLPTAPAVFLEVKHEIVHDHLRDKLVALLKSAQELDFTLATNRASRMVFEASTRLGKETISFELANNGGSRSPSTGITVLHRLNDRTVFKVIDLTREGGNQNPAPTATLKSRERVEDYLPMLFGWLHLTNHASHERILTLQQEDVRAQIEAYLGACLADSGLEKIGVSLSWPTGGNTGWINLTSSTISSSSRVNTAYEIMNHFRPRMGGAWELGFETSGTVLLRVQPQRDYGWEINSLGIIETMKAMRDPRLEGLSFKIGT